MWHTIADRHQTIYEKSISLGASATINQCEIYAILDATNYLNKSMPRNKSIIFYSDSLTTLHRLSAEYTKSNLTLETHNALNELSTNNKVQIQKVKAHIGIKGNERADLLAKNGAGRTPIGPEPFIQQGMRNIVNKLIEKARKDTEIRITNKSPNPKSQLLNLTLHNRLHPNIISKDKSMMRALTQMLTGQN